MLFLFPLKKFYAAQVTKSDDWIVASENDERDFADLCKSDYRRWMD